MVLDMSYSLETGLFDSIVAINACCYELLVNSLAEHC